MSAFDRAMAFTLGEEGGSADVAGDRGGHTSRGMTQRLYDAYRASKGLAQQDVTLMTAEEERAIWREEFWAPCRCDELPDELAICMFDMAVNSSPANAKRTLQRALGVTQDGVLGPGTLAAVHADGVGADLALRFLKARAGFIAEVCIHDVSQLAFLHGWLNRLFDLTHEVNA